MQTRGPAFLLFALIVALPWACSSSSDSGNGGAGGITEGAGGESNPTLNATSTGHGSTSSGAGGGPYACDAPADAPSKGACFTENAAGGGNVAASTAATGTASAGDATSGAGGATTGTQGAGGAGAGGMGGGASSCDVFGTTNACGACLNASCCQASVACNMDPDCIQCFTNTAGAMNCDQAEVKALIADLSACEMSTCATECGYGKACNPVTNAGCDGPNGYACDYASSGFQCFPPPSMVPLCGACSNGATGPFCSPGLRCMTTDPTDPNSPGVCARYCCNDGDCGSGSCDLTVAGFGWANVGICVSGK